MQAVNTVANVCNARSNQAIMMVGDTISYLNMVSISFLRRHSLKELCECYLRWKNLYKGFVEDRWKVPWPEDDRCQDSVARQDDRMTRMRKTINVMVEQLLLMVRETEVQSIAAIDDQVIAASGGRVTPIEAAMSSCWG